MTISLGGAEALADVCLVGDPRRQAWFAQFLARYEAVVAPAAGSVDAGRSYPRDGVQALCEAGAAGVLVPTAHGGLGFDRDMALLCVVHLARACPSTAAVFMFHHQVVHRTLAFATPQLQALDLPRLASGHCMGSSAWSEAGAGAAKQALASCAEPSAEGYVLRGRKDYCTGLSGAGVLHVLMSVVASDGVGQPTFFRVAAEAVSEVQIEPLVGMRGTDTGSFSLAGTPVDVLERLGEVGEGRVLMRHNQHSGFNPGLLVLGAAHGMADALQAALQSPAHRHKARYESLRHLVARLCLAVDAGYAYLAHSVTQRSRSPEAHARFKAHAVDSLTRFAHEIASGTGMLGLAPEFGIERRVRDILAINAMGPVNEIIYDGVFAHHFEQPHDN